MSGSKEGSPDVLVGSLIDERFRVIELAARGGMGSVYRAFDESNERTVALKSAHLDGLDRLRFQREARLLSELAHDGIVRYVAHGESRDGWLYLAMEWVEGPSLFERLLRGPLSIVDAVTLGLRLAEGLEHVHEHAIVHRDVKPSNIILPAGEVSATKLVDLGVARSSRDDEGLTQTGMIVGTVCYMAPEQLRGPRSIDPRADLFALGCVLYEGLTGSSPFSGRTTAEAYAKVLSEEPLALGSARPETPEVFAELVTALLEKNAADRPSRARDVAEALRGVAGALPESSAQPRVSLPASVENERRLSTVLLIGAGRGDVHGLVPEGATARRESDDSWSWSFDSTQAPEDHGPAARAARAARAALELREALVASGDSSRPLALWSGRFTSDVEQTFPSPLSEPAASLLERSLALGRSAILLDDLSAALLATRFSLHDEPGGGASLLKELESEELPAVRRQLLGQEIPCVGRRKELALLEATCEEVEEDSVARAVLVTGPAGIGKSRLGAELLDRLRGGRFRALIARSSPMTANASGAVLRALVRSAAGLSRGGELAASFESLHAYLRELGIEEPLRAAEILGEVSGAPRPTDPSAALQAARADPKVLRHWLERIVPRWLAAECGRQPLLLVLEDLHWADGASVHLIDDALSQLGNHPILWFGLARPEVRERFDSPMSGLLVQEVPLGGLTQKAASALIAAALPGLDASVVESITERARGNAFFLEELIRATASGQSAQPTTVLAVAEARLERLDPESRRALRAASVLGPVFSAGAVAHLLGEIEPWPVVSMLEELVLEEILEQAGEPSPDEDEPSRYAFRHILLRDAAYATISVPDRAPAHALAASWLEQHGDDEPAVLAEHWELAGELAKAARQHALAAEAALYRGDVRAAMHASERGLQLRPSDEVRGRLTLVLADALFWAGRFGESATQFKPAVELLRDRSDSQIRAIGTFALAASYANDLESFGEAVQALGDPNALAPSIQSSEAVCFVGFAHIRGANLKRARRYLDALLEMDRRVGGEQPLIRAYAMAMQGIFCAVVDDFPLQHLSRRRAHEAFSSVGVATGAAPVTAALLAYDFAFAGAFDDAHALVREIRDRSRRTGAGLIQGYADVAFAVALHRTECGQALKLLQEACDSATVEARMLALTFFTTLAFRMGRKAELGHALARLEAASLAMSRGLPNLIRGLQALEEDEPEIAHEALRASEESAIQIGPIGTLRHQLRVRVHHARGEVELARGAAEAALKRFEAMAAVLFDSNRSTFWSQGFEVPETLLWIERVLGPRASDTPPPR